MERENESRILGVVSGTTAYLVLCLAVNDIAVVPIFAIILVMLWLITGVY